MQLNQTPLFVGTGIDTSTVAIREFPGNYTIELEGSTSSYVAVILSGSINVQTYTVQGNPILISTLTEGMEFGDVLIYGSSRHTYPGNIVTKGPTKLAIIPNQTIEAFIQSNDKFLHNVLGILSNKVIAGTLNSKLLSQDTIRDKILYFLAQEQTKQASKIIQLHRTKEDLAKLLHVTRPSLSRELSFMKQEGLIDYDRKTITIKK